MIRKEKENWSKEFQGIQLECDDGRQGTSTRDVDR